MSRDETLADAKLQPVAMAVEETIVAALVLLIETYGYEPGEIYRLVDRAYQETE